MDDRIPYPLRETLARYHDLLNDLFPGNVRGIYLHGSIALGAFDERRSDIDFVTLLGCPVTSHEIGALRRLHRRLRRVPFGRVLDGLYLEDGRRPLGIESPTGNPYFNKGRFQGHHPFRPLACALLHGQGIAVVGDAPQDVFRSVPVEQIRDEMSFNLHSYWSVKAERSYLFLFDPWVDFALATLSRILHTLETGEIISKQDAVPLLRKRFDGFDRLIDDVEARFTGGRSARVDRVTRARYTVRLIRDVVEYADKRYLPGPTSP